MEKEKEQAVEAIVYNCICNLQWHFHILKIKPSELIKKIEEITNKLKLGMISDKEFEERIKENEN